jgi:hypothetical protein
MQRYLRVWCGLTVALVVLVAATNLIVDPYGLFRLVDSAAFNAIKPKAGAHGRMVKAYQVLRVGPRSVILGNSRSEVGFDPRHPAWPEDARPVFNLAIPGTGTSTTLRYLQHVIAGDAGREGTRVAVWGIDFMDFLVDEVSASGAASIRQGASRLLTDSDRSMTSRRALSQLRDFGEVTFALGTFVDSLETVRSQRNPYSADLTPLGFNPMSDYVKITADEGYWAVFRQRDLANIRAYLGRPKAIFNESGGSSPALEDLRKVMQLCRQSGIKLHLVTYPYHAHLLEVIRITGHWPAFEAWKRAVVKIVDDEARVSGGTATSLWDFSEFNAFTTEAIPPKGDRRTRMRWYWEAGHFKRELGDLILARILGSAGADPPGVLLGPSTIEQRIALVRTQEVEYRRTHSREVEELEDIAARLGSRR